VVEAIDAADVQALGALESFFNVVSIARRDEFVFHPLDDDGRSLYARKCFSEPFQFVFQRVDFFVAVHPVLRKAPFDERELGCLVVPLPLLYFRVHVWGDQYESFNQVRIVGRHANNHRPA